MPFALSRQRLSTPDSAPIAILNGTTPTPIHLRPSGPAFGPLHLSAAGTTPVVVRQLDWRGIDTADHESGIWIFGAVMVPAASFTSDRADSRADGPGATLTRREVLASAAVLAGGAASTGAASAASQPIAVLTFDATPSDVTVSILDAVGDVLPADATYELSWAGGTATLGPDTPATIPAGTTGTVTLARAGSGGWLPEINVPNPLADTEAWIDKKLEEVHNLIDDILNTEDDSHE